jgi:hypothetical protein
VEFQSLPQPERPEPVVRLTLQSSTICGWIFAFSSVPNSVS